MTFLFIKWNLWDSKVLGHSNYPCNYKEITHVPVLIKEKVFICRFNMNKPVQRFIRDFE